MALPDLEINVAVFHSLTSFSLKRMLSLFLNTWSFSNGGSLVLETLSRSRDVLRVSISCILLTSCCCSGSDSSSESSSLGIMLLDLLCLCFTSSISFVSTLLFVLLFLILVDRVNKNLHD